MREVEIASRAARHGSRPPLRRSTILACSSQMRVLYGRSSDLLAGRFSGIHAGMLRDNDLALLWAENQALRTQLAHAHAQLAQAVEQLAAAQQPLAERE